ncbi:MAG: hypothetical protein A4E48_01761 [Methanosaeta sp. PtaU1.Bin060]|nr:MAG: hypothetical protein A4E48_01761 [Methanosaeta sp. PtaU1.Bin060]
MPPSRAPENLDLGCFIHRIAAVTIVVLMITGTSLAGIFDFNPDQQGNRYKNEMQNDVTGTGYVFEYMKVNTNNLSLLQYSHGSGSMDFADIVSSEQKKTTKSGYYYYVDANGNWVKKYGATSTISMTRQYDNKQSPTSFAYGTGWYASHPVTYNSLLKDKTDAKSYQEAIAMERQIEYARGVKGDIAVDLNCTGPTAKADGKGIASMKIADDVAQGTMHISERMVNTLRGSDGKLKEMKIQGVKNTVIDVDLNYIGDFSVQKNMKAEITKYQATWYEPWLPCCFGGFNDIPSHNLLKERSDVAGIFDCTCRETSLSTFKPEWNGSTAQFPESTYGSKP